MENKEKKETKFDFKKETKKAWDSTLRFLRPFKNLDKNVLAEKFEPFLKKHIQMVYVIGCAVLGIFAICDLRFFPVISTILAQWIVLLVIFIIFRLLCELVAGKK